MPWDDSKSTFRTRPNVPDDEKLQSSEWNTHVGDQKARGYNSLSTQTTDYTAKKQEIVLADASGGVITITLPTPESAASVVIKKIDASDNNVIIATPNNETIDGDSTKELNSEYLSLEITSDGSDYYILY